jgi:hypothetical protein
LLVLRRMQRAGHVRAWEMRRWDFWTWRCSVDANMSRSRGRSSACSWLAGRGAALGSGVGAQHYGTAKEKTAQNEAMDRHCCCLCAQRLHSMGQLPQAHGGRQAAWSSPQGLVDGRPAASAIGSQDERRGSPLLRGGRRLLRAPEGSASGRGCAESGRALQQGPGL